MKNDFAAVVRRHWRETTGYLVADREPCITVAHDEIRHVKRRFEFVALENVPALTPLGSWFMGVIVCPDDDLTGLAQWAQKNDASRVHFYFHKDTHLRQLTPWQEAGLSLDNIESEITSWRALHKLLGWDLNLQVYDDHGPA